MATPAPTATPFGTLAGREGEGGWREKEGGEQEKEGGREGGGRREEGGGREGVDVVERG